ncbi:hypothetical protein CAL7716_099930 (plasmid) [Calothrix sp. PCC 7716]|nr:hypothetical protein CAL7716_099930 [Calothrix sp. PCC 7716]
MAHSHNHGHDHEHNYGSTNYNRAFVVKELHDNFGIEHPTIQVETGDSSYSCPFISEHSV